MRYEEKKMLMSINRCDYTAREAYLKKRTALSIPSSSKLLSKSYEILKICGNVTLIREKVFFSALKVRRTVDRIWGRKRKPVCFIKCIEFRLNYFPRVSQLKRCSWPICDAHCSVPSLIALLVSIETTSDPASMSGCRAEHGSTSRFS